MSEDRPLKSAYELAMERLRAQDREQGIQESKPLTQKQKEQITRLRQDAQAKLAELAHMHKEKLAAAGDDPVKIDDVEKHFQIDRRRIESSLESSIARVKKG